MSTQLNSLNKLDYQFNVWTFHSTILQFNIGILFRKISIENSHVLTGKSFPNIAVGGTALHREEQVGLAYVMLVVALLGFMPSKFVCGREGERGVYLVGPVDDCLNLLNVFKYLFFRQRLVWICGGVVASVTSTAVMQ